MKDALLRQGKSQFDWASRRMPALKLAEKYIMKKLRPGKNLPFSGLSLSACLHVSKESAVFLETLSRLGMKVYLVAANPLSSQDEIASYLASRGLDVRGRRGESARTYLKEIKIAARLDPDLIVDDGGELHVAYAKTDSNSCFGGTDETTSGTQRLIALDKEGLLRYPVIPVNEARTKHLFDNKYGTGQSSIDGLLRATGILLAGRVVVVAGYGWVGKGVAMRARGLGSRVVVTEVDEIRALEAHLDGFEVMRMDSAVKIGQVYLTCTGQIGVITMRHLERMSDGAILGNCGHFDMEIDLNALRNISSRHRKLRPNVEEYRVRGKSLYLLCEGRVINLVAAEGHPPELMQLSFATQLLSLYYIISRRGDQKFGNKVLPVPAEVEDAVSSIARASFNLKIDRLNERQKEYLRSFNR